MPFKKILGFLLGDQAKNSQFKIKKHLFSDPSQFFRVSLVSFQTFLFKEKKAVFLSLLLFFETTILMYR